MKSENEHGKQDERADRLRALYTEHVTHPDGHWKGSARAVVPKEIADEVQKAMNFMGSLVDSRQEVEGWVLLTSLGYWAHGF